MKTPYNLEYHVRNAEMFLEEFRKCKWWRFRKKYKLYNNYMFTLELIRIHNIKE